MTLCELAPPAQNPNYERSTAICVRRDCEAATGTEMSRGSLACSGGNCHEVNRREGWPRPRGFLRISSFPTGRDRSRSVDRPMRPEVLARIAASSGHMIASGTYHLDRADPDRCAARQANPQTPHGWGQDPDPPCSGPRRGGARRCRGRDGAQHRDARMRPVPRRLHAPGPRRRVPRHGRTRRRPARDRRRARACSRSPTRSPSRATGRAFSKPCPRTRGP
jgi:hypothetical protein